VEESAGVSDSSTALIVVDMQNDFVLPGAPGCVAGAMATVPRLREVLDAFRSAKRPIFHVVREYRADGSDIEFTRLKRFMDEVKMVVPGTPGCEIVKDLTPLPGEYRVVKNRFSGFMNTELDLMLRRLRVETVAICGTQYPNCIRATVFDAVSLGYETFVVTDATSAQTPQIAEANILDMRNIGVTCLPFAEARKRLGV
jgi:nicotinamidase-related amidase